MTYSVPAVVRPDIDDRPDTACAVCPHPWAEHDRISVRYCTAASATGRGNGCVCVPATTTTGSRTT
ncbi:MAG TPA: RGCVC family protein [Pseudonocardiaceae bacterium]